MHRSRRLSRLTRGVAGLAAGVGYRRHAMVVAASPGARADRDRERAPRRRIRQRRCSPAPSSSRRAASPRSAGRSRCRPTRRRLTVPGSRAPWRHRAGLGGGAPLAGEAGKRRLGRALAAGVTTAATTDAPPAASGDPISAPRLLPQPRDGEAAAGGPPGSRPLRNGTIAVALDGDPRAAAGAARTAKARVALAGLAGADGTIDPARLAATGLAPLEAVTAMTSGGAWALGLQSDRGLLAPGMRADLVVVAGDLDRVARRAHGGRARLSRRRRDSLRRAASRTGARRRATGARDTPPTAPAAASEPSGASGGEDPHAVAAARARTDAEERPARAGRAVSSGVRRGAGDTVSRIGGAGHARTGGRGHGGGVVSRGAEGVRVSPGGALRRRAAARRPARRLRARRHGQRRRSAVDRLGQRRRDDHHHGSRREGAARSRAAGLGTHGRGARYRSRARR